MGSVTRSRFTAQQVIDAYQSTGSVWRAAKELGISGQSVHERLKAVGYPLAARNWTPEEVDELRSLVDHCTISEIASRLGRPYHGVAVKVSRLGIGSRTGSRRPVKIPRGAGYDKASIKKYAGQIDESGSTVHAFARRNGLGVEALCVAMERNLPDWWEAYRRAHSDLPEKDCPYCERTFIPSNSRQIYCSRRCGNTRRVDDDYFGGKRRQTIGLAEGRCQLCGRTSVKALSSHHMLGKENDPDNDFLIALCSGCHQLVTLLASRKFLEEAEGWQSLIELTLLRHYGNQEDVAGVETYVEIDTLTPDEALELAEVLDE